MKIGKKIMDYLSWFFREVFDVLFNDPSGQGR
jgi:hypothetical protein